MEAVGSQGSGDGELDSPAGIAFDGENSFFVTDSGNQRVVRLFDETFQDNLNVCPFGIAVNTVTADVYVTGADTSTLHRFSSDGTLLGTFGSFGGGVNQFENPLGVAVDDKGSIPTNQVFVADTGNSRIQRMSDTGFFTARFGSQGSGNGQFLNPEGIAIDASRNVVVADTGNNRIQVLNQAGQMIRAFGSQGGGIGQFNRPVAVAIDENGNIFVVDQGNHRVQSFSSDGQFLDTFGQQGSGIGQFNGPTGIVIEDGAIVVVDTGNHRVQGFFPGGQLSENLSTVSQSGSLRGGEAVAAKQKSKDQGSRNANRKRGGDGSRR